MENDFLVVPLESSLFSSLDDAALSEFNAQWINVDSKPGYPCRVSLEDAEIGERVLAINYCHHSVDTAYKASGPIFIRENAVTACLSKNEIPKMLRHRLLSLRAYNSEGNMVNAIVTEGRDLDVVINKLLMDQCVEYIQIHNARPGCFNCTVVRA
ncbi:DUF1203 domain-containing protein [uncultured Microbulbifer sp.]|uniref:DUF1203 domain-containing protein n=1 Tax=uncultured Microbulbifer sp. TaxID=348147 RepID=UPI0026275F40|nr:DUF1203 domain-containing protein [uncultured Microbulbifer sp.]